MTSASMDNLFDLIIPILFVVGSIFVNRMIKKGQDEEGSAEESDQGRNLRDEIRRQIEERRRQLEEAVEQQQQRFPTSQTSMPMQLPSPEPPRPVHRPSPVNRYEEMRHQIDEMRMKAEEEQRKAASIMKGRHLPPTHAHHAHATMQHYSSKGLIAEVIRDLHHPASARKAIINAEILGAPIGLRRPGQNQASWEL